MKPASRPTQSGIALVVVMICVTVLAGLAAGFAYSMKVETRLARNARAESDFYPLAMSAVDYCKSILAASGSCPEEQFDAETQVWAGGTMSACSNNILAMVKPTVELGPGRFTWKMTDLERRANINTAASDQMMLDQAMRLLGVDAGDSGAIIASIMDWIDPDKNPHVSGTESDYYESQVPPYKAKDGYMDDLSELLLVRGVTPELYGLEGALPPPPPPEFRDDIGFDEAPAQRATLKQLFTTLSTGQININTASAEVLQLVPFIDENIAQRIIWCRNGQDTGVPVPFRNPGEALNCAGMNPTIIGQIQNRFSVRSSTFEVHIDCEIDGIHRQYYAVLRRNNPRDIQVLTFHWKLTAPNNAGTR
jgi:type II secretory pathway component PulK